MFFERRCVVCHEPDGPACGRCRDRLVRLGHVPGADRRAAVQLDERAKAIVAALKYRRERRLAIVIANELLPLVPAGADLVTWVPATPARARRRGFDQGEEVARAVARLGGFTIARCLRRARRDTRQTERSLSDRATGPQLASTREIGGLTVVIDDVMTSGATLNRCAEVLGAAGADRVVGVAFASTPRRRA